MRTFTSFVGRAVTTQSGRQFCHRPRPAFSLPGKVEALVVGRLGLLERLGIAPRRPTRCRRRGSGRAHRGRADRRSRRHRRADDALSLGERCRDALVAGGCRGGGRGLVPAACRAGRCTALRAAGCRLRKVAWRTWLPSDLELGYAGVKAHAGFADGAVFAVALFSVERPELVALIEADRLGRLRTGAASAVAAKHLAPEGATTLGVIGCGDQAETQVFVHPRCSSDARARPRLLPHGPATCRAFCKRVGAEPAESHREAGEQDIVVTITTSRDPVLRGEWLQPGALVCAAGANNPAARELDNVVLERASLVCCDSLEQARIESGRSDRAGRTRRARLARGARAAGGRRRRASRPSVARRHRRVQVERARSLGRRDRGGRRSSVRVN